MSHCTTPLLTALLKLEKDGPLLSHAGICDNVAELLVDPLESRILRELIRDKCGTSMYPIEGSYVEYAAAGDRKWQDPRRLALLDWLIEELQKDVRTTTQDAES